MAARIRTVKPEFWCSEQVAECSTNARLLFVGLWNFADDGGIHPASAKQLKMEVFPGDPFTLDQIVEWVSELRKVGLVAQYEAQGKVWWGVTGWHHQRIDKPRCKHPPLQTDDGSTTVRRPFDDASPPYWSLKESKGREPSVKDEPEKTPTDDWLDSVKYPDGFDAPDVRDSLTKLLAHLRTKGKSYIDPPMQFSGVLESEFAAQALKPADFVRAVNFSVGGDFLNLQKPDDMKPGSDTGGGVRMGEV